MKTKIKIISWSSCILLIVCLITLIIGVAIKNNIDSIGVSYGYGIEDELIDSMPTFIVNDIKDILNIVNEEK